MSHSDRLDFYNPFSSVATELRFKKAGLPNIDLKKPSAKEPLKFPFKGQGVVALHVPKGGQGLMITVSTGSTAQDAPSKLFLILGRDSCDLRYGVSPENSLPITWNVLKTQEACYFQYHRDDMYWLSVDQNNGWIRFGRTLTSVTMAVGEAQLKRKDAGGTLVWKAPEKFSWLENVQHISFNVIGGNNEAVERVVFPKPLVFDLPPFIVDRNDVTLMDLEANSVTLPESLSAECQYLYRHVSGPNITLKDPKFPHFARAIEESVNTEGKIAWQMLQNKANGFGHSDIKSTYLRITLGRNMGDSPGVPYVLEIWPAGHHSPIHDHGKSNAIIKVLHGSIQAQYYDSLDNQLELGNPATFIKGAITWIDSEHYQIHKLTNTAPEGGAVCCTIQCYRYSERDQVHFEGFRYIPNEGGTPQTFKPNSDMSYSDFRAAIQKEWNDAHPGFQPDPDDDD